MSLSNPIRIAAVVFSNEKGQVLSVRKAGTEMFMLPGGKLEPGETPAEAAIRELTEELHFELEEDDIDLFGRFQAPAANEPGFYVDCYVFTPIDMILNYTPAVFEELVEAKYFPLNSKSPTLAPLSREVFAALASAEY